MSETSAPAGRASGGESRRLDSRTGPRRAGEDPAARHRDLGQRLRAVASLGEDWDSYGAGRLDGHVLRRVEEFVAGVLRSGAPIPDLTPSSSGSVIAEWRAGADLIEIHFDPAGEDLVCLEESGETAVEHEGPVDDMPETIRARLERLLARMAGREAVAQD